MPSWKEYVIAALTDLGGLSHYSDLYDKIEKVKKEALPPSWKAIIRRTIETNSSDSDAWDKKNDIFYSAEGIGNGVWGLRAYIPKLENVDLTEDDISFPEGKKFLRQHILRERNPKLIIEAKKRFKTNNGVVFCEVCGFNFEEKYGLIGRDFIEGHHIKPISEMEEGERTKIDDIILVCSNCHKMLHRKRPWLTKIELENLIINPNK